MTPLTDEWVSKAEGDFVSAQREPRARKAPNYDAACFHAQQCVEKYLKARLQEAAIAFGKTHDLVALMQLLLPIEPLFASLEADVRALDRYAVDYRYPGLFASRTTARDAVAIGRRVRALVRQSLAMPD